MAVVRGCNGGGDTGEKPKIVNRVPEKKMGVPNEKLHNGAGVVPLRALLLATVELSSLRGSKSSSLSSSNSSNRVPTVRTLSLWLAQGRIKAGRSGN